MTEKRHQNQVEISILFKEYKMFNSEDEAGSLEILKKRKKQSKEN
jgi:hypothetical protein